MIRSRSPVTRPRCQTRSKWAVAGASIPGARSPGSEIEGTEPSPGVAAPARNTTTMTIDALRVARAGKSHPERTRRRSPVGPLISAGPNPAKSRVIWREAARHILLFGVRQVVGGVSGHLHVTLEGVSH